MDDSARSSTTRPETTTRSEPADPLAVDTTTGAEDSELLWGVGAVATRLNLPPATLRTWERRYGVGPSARTAGGHRRYNEQDILRAQVVAHLIARGVPPQAGARVALSLDHDGLVAALVENGSDGTGGVDPDMQPEVAIQSIIAAAHQGAPDELGHLYARVLSQWGVVAGWDSVLAPSLVRIGDLWFDGLIGVEGEHLASERLASELRAYTRRKRPQAAEVDPVVLASADDEMHALPLLALEAALATQGLTCYALGARVPARALEHTIRRKDPRVVLLWASIARPQPDPTWDVLNASDEDLTVLLGGPGWPDRSHEARRGISVPTSLGDAVDKIRGALQR